MYDELVKRLRYAASYDERIVIQDCKEAANIIEELTATDVRPVVKAVWKHVQWVVDEEWQEGGYWISRCSNCSMPYHTETPFCPHCGADMREES